jgi:hypothetical protein
MIFVWRLFTMHLSRSRRWDVGLLAALALAACSIGGTAPTPTLPPVVVTVYQAGTSTPLAGATPTPGIGAATPDPGQPPATAIPQYGPDAYPDNVNPLTGEVADPAKLNRIPVAVKISNFPYNVRPQFGLSLADIVFEHLAEAGLTRFTAIFLQNDAAKVGSIRSARFIDTEIAPMFQALLVTSGSSLGTMDHLRSSEWFAGANVWRLVSEESHYVCPPLCRETPDDANTLFANTETLRAATTANGSNSRAALTGLAFSSQPPLGAPVTEILIDYSLAAHVSWRYNGVRYMRWQEKDSGGEMAAHVDALTSAPISAANVVVLFVNHQNNFVPEDFRDGGNCGLEIQLWTIGPAKIFRDGQLIEGRWRRDGSTNMRLRLETDAGQVIPLGPGNTWFDVVTLTASGALNGSTYTVTNKVPDTKYSCPVPPTETPTLTPEGYVAPTETPTP